MGELILPAGDAIVDAGARRRWRRRRGGAGDVERDHGEAGRRLGQIGDHYKKRTDAIGCDRDAMLDSLCDQIVTATGVAHMFGMDIQGALNEVNRSNWSKFVDGKPVFDINGKIAKPATYSKPDLSAFVGVQS